MDTSDIAAYMAHVGAAARAAATGMAASPVAKRDAALTRLAALLRSEGAALAEANAKDLQAAAAHGLEGPMLDRLKLTPAAIATVAEGCEQIAAMPDPVGEIVELKRR